jgi:hypothetical protein
MLRAVGAINKRKRLCRSGFFSFGWDWLGRVGTLMGRYWGGPWSGPGYSYAGWDDYASRYGIGCTPGTVITGGDGIPYLCQ